MNPPLKPPPIRANDFSYELPPDRIAAHPLADRDSSRLLLWDAGRIEHLHFGEVPERVPSGALLVVNDSRVIRARIAARKPTGGAAEILCLEPVFPSRDPAVTLSQASPSTWACVIGGKNIGPGSVLSSKASSTSPGVELSARVLSRDATEAEVEMSWEPAALSFAAVLEALGQVPLPPYFKREAVAEDITRYQTVYADQSGSVAAPTAGLHFTESVLGRLRERGVSVERVTLHVGAGTFRPIESETIDAHRMHQERIRVSARFLERLESQLARREKGEPAPVVAVGTTSLRTLESIALFGAALLRDSSPSEMQVGQWDALELSDTRAPASALVRNVLTWLDWRGSAVLEGETQLMVAPGHDFRIVDALFTNFHQPGSTLMLLVAAFVGSDWKRIYEEALAGGYRFLSYGDSSLLIRRRKHDERSAGT